MGLAFLITSDRLQLLSERKVLKQAEYAAMLDAAGLVATARQEAQRLRTEAVADARREKQHAIAQGLEQARIDHAAQLVRGADGQHEQLASMRDAMARLVSKAVAQLVAETDAAQVYASALQRVETLIRDESFIALRVAPGDEQAVRRALAALGQAQGATLDAAVQVDAALPPGRCVLHTAGGTVELGVRAQLEAFGRALRDSGEGAWT